MANSKAKIQNIPLTGSLNFNLLKTDISPFEGYNDKNSTVYGGTLGPFYDKKTDLMEGKNYTFFGKSEDAYTLKVDETDNLVYLYKNGTRISPKGSYIPHSKKLQLPSDAVWGSCFMVKNPSTQKKRLIEVCLRPVDSNNNAYWTFWARASESDNAWNDIDTLSWKIIQNQNPVSIASAPYFRCASAYFADGSQSPYSFFKNKIILAYCVTPNMQTADSVSTYCVGMELQPFTDLEDNLWPNGYQYFKTAKQAKIGTYGQASIIIGENGADYKPAGGDNIFANYNRGAHIFFLYNSGKIGRNAGGPDFSTGASHGEFGENPNPFIVHAGHTSSGYGAWTDTAVANSEILCSSSYAALEANRYSQGKGWNSAFVYPNNTLQNYPGTLEWNGYTGNGDDGEEGHTLCVNPSAITSVNERTLEVYQYATRTTYPLTTGSAIGSHWDIGVISGKNITTQAVAVAENSENVNMRNYTTLKNHVKTTGQSAGFVPSVLKNRTRSDVPSTNALYSPLDIYYYNGTLLGISMYRKPIDTYTQFNGANISIGWHIEKESGNYSSTSHLGGAGKKYVKDINYAGSDGFYYYHIGDYSEYMDTETTEKDVLKQLVLDDKYVFLYGDDLPDYDTTLDQFVNLNPGYIFHDFPVFTYSLKHNNYPTDTNYSAWYAGGFHAGYARDGSDIVGYLPNPYIMTCCTDSMAYTDKYDRTIQTYLTVGSQPQSAMYNGQDDMYLGTLYPVQSDGNTFLPWAFTNTLIKGYNNNDMVKSGNTTYKINYFNNNAKRYNFFMLSGIENVDNVFAIQSQTYAVDENCIYNITYNGGSISSVNAISYKKNLKYLGTLPSMAVFWSDFNKTFYSFTGDAILKKMWEASDIDEILYVGQNPSSLSLWICTNSGIYVISETDQYRLDFICNQIDFRSDHAILVTHNEDLNEKHVISLRDLNNEAELIPIKLKTKFYGLGNELKSVIDCWYIRVFTPDKRKGYLTIKVNTITDVSRNVEEKTFNISPSDYDENGIVYLKYQPKYQSSVGMQVSLESDLEIYELACGINESDAVAQLSHNNF